MKHPGSGIGNYVFNLIQNLARRTDNENEYILFINSFNQEIFDQLKLTSAFSLIKVPSYPIDKIQDQLGLLKAIGKANLDFFHVTHHDATPILVKTPLTITVHDIAPLEFPSFPLIHKNYYRIFSQLALTRAQHVFCDSENTGKAIEKYFSFCRGKWSTIYLGRDTYFQPVQDTQIYLALCQKLGIIYPYLLYVGTFARRKNLTNMIRAFSIVKKSNPQVHFVIVGKPSGRDDLLPDEVPNGVIYAGEINKPELLSLYNNAELLLFVTFYEGFGLPVLEAMSCGCPVVLSPTASLPELGGEAALYAKPDRPENIAAQVMRILNDKELRNTLAEKGFKQAEKFNWEIAIDKMLNIYHILSKKPDKK